jgi:hypothetical protein
MCLLYMAEELRVGDLCVSGSDAYADYRAHLLPWRECEQRLPDYCAKGSMRGCRPAMCWNILANIEHWTHFKRHFGPLSGTDPQIRKAAERYLLTIFAMGCNLGPTHAARHLDTDVTAHMLSFVNRRHMSLEKLETAQRDLIELYLRLDLPKHWGMARPSPQTAPSTISTTTTCWPAITYVIGKGRRRVPARRR